MKRITLLFLFSMLLFGFNLPKKKILIIGDSISIGYTPFVKESLSSIAEVEHNEDNARFTGYGLEHINDWIGDTQWDLIQFNWGLWDLAYRGGKNKEDSQATTSLGDYERNLDSLVSILENTGAKLIFVATSYVPEQEPERFEQDAVKYNKVAKKVMKKHKIPVNELYKKSKDIHKTQGLGDRNVHYEEEGYKELAQLVVKFIEEQVP